MLRVPSTSALHALVAGLCVLIGSAHAGTPDPAGTLHNVPLPGGLSGALAVIGDRAAPDRSRFLVELIRRVHDRPATVGSSVRDAVLTPLLAHLDRASGSAPASETLPLPLTTEIWIDVVFGGRATPETLVSSILRSRNAALLYHALLSMDERTRAWIGTERALLTQLAAEGTAPFLAAAPGLRVADGRVSLPGGAAAEASWRTLVDADIAEPAQFVRALVSGGDGRLAYFYGAIAGLSPAQIGFALRLDAPDRAVRADAARRLFAVYERLAATWRIEDRAFWRPRLDPALLAQSLTADEGGRPIVPGTRRFWESVFSPGGARRATAVASDALADTGPPDFAWLCERVFASPQLDLNGPYYQVLFASRVVGQVTPEIVPDAIDAVRAVATYPALVRTLERAGIADVRLYARAARVAGRLSSIDNPARTRRSSAQFQGALALLARAASRGSLSASAFADAVARLCDLDVSSGGEYEGRLVRWLHGYLSAAPAAPPERPLAMDGLPAPYEDAPGTLDRDLLTLIAGRTTGGPQTVDWEGTRYRVDLPRAEWTRLVRLLGERPAPHLSSALTIARIAEGLREPGVAAPRIRDSAADLARVSAALGQEGDEREADDTVDALRQAADTLQRAAGNGRLRDADRLTARLLVVADELCARGLTELVYAIALGSPDDAIVSAGDAARRHDFGQRPSPIARHAPWHLAVPTADRARDWRATGSLLSLDVQLADLLLVRLSSRPPSVRPMLNDLDRRGFTRAVALMEPAALTDADRDAIVGAVNRGRTRVATVGTPAEASALARELGWGPLRAGLLAWTFEHDLERARVSFSPGDLLHLGLDGRPLPPAWHAWGAPSEPTLGALGLRMPAPAAWERLAGRWDAGMLSSACPELNLRLAESLAALQMPAALLPFVLAPATLELVNGAASRDQDDYRGPVEFVLNLRPEQVEQYLALLTTDGPLVPVEESAQAATESRGVPNPGGEL